ncbi:MAG: M48 family metallopeptidase, partial [Acidobacteriia bacterium]|nr:M48 family metallopeptidase [Terriglobia bacterium]
MPRSLPLQVSPMEDSPRVKRYHRTRRVLGVVGFVADLAVIVVLLFTGWTITLRVVAEYTVRQPALALLVYLLLFGAITQAVDLPLDFLKSFWLERRYNLSNLSLGGWVKDHLKGFALGGALAMLGCEFLYWTMRRWPEAWWIISAVAFVAFFVLLANLAPVLIFPLFFKFKPVENADLQNRVNRLARRTGTHVCGIFEWSLGEKTRKANAAVVGWGNTRRIIVSDTLLENFSGEEIEVIMAHELCHHVKNHIWYGMVLQSILTFIAFDVAHHVLVPLSRSFGLKGIADVANFPLLALSLTTLSLLVLPVANYFSRRLETEADLYALDITGDSLAFVSSMEKLADLNLANKTPNKIIEFIFYSHPSIEDRIK